MRNTVFIATSLDGYIADKNGDIDWLNSVPNPDNQDTGFFDLMSRIDAIVMGRNTLDIVLSFDGEWPYPKPVFVLSNSLSEVPDKYKDKIEILKGKPSSILKHLRSQGYENLYIDGGKTIQGFLQEDLIDEIVITQFPILLGGGSPLFGSLLEPLSFKLQDSKIVLSNLVQTTFFREK